MKDGTRHEGQCVQTKGERAKPHTPAELDAKFFELGEPVWGKAKTRELYDGLARVEQIADFRDFAGKLDL